MRSLRTKRVVEDFSFCKISATARIVSFIPTGFLDSKILTFLPSISNSSARPKAALKPCTVSKISRSLIPNSWATKPAAKVLYLL